MKSENCKRSFLRLVYQIELTTKTGPAAREHMAECAAIVQSKADRILVDAHKALKIETVYLGSISVSGSLTTKKKIK